ncbi:bile acid:sodium symporter family protein [Nocardioides marmotae]|uniref:Bile acid:sodium symporter family protein n=1 Tax=Nocardioides marmotae TaxID=2663857 RepID=A0A6I3JF99_9ACTN|nr:bile acid:sodium symporter family protein [Nocardioides marmotae]MCR6033289.1 bile acid:sodium symporter family protein [Gordonia jinghuaiqii]MBC9734041.1 bile acid:sodium symporter family protein [Nocardioides marmotae]MTB85144.1 bile acid:sodium symporter family protein [Nocardioides marmotae]MTB96946.1 bile acid:sodium symporter family protein [Nocardioides marmotae]QKE00671.1 bile acid:sodium symporter family protein [Nocardioides marmotae]
MDSALTTIGLPVALGIIMLGLGLSLVPDDFRRVARHPKAVGVALACQLVLLPLFCFGLVTVLDLPPLLAVGMMLLAASPGGTSANLYSHLFRGDVALNVTLTAINSIVAIATLPVITNLAIAHYGLGDEVSLQFTKVVEVFAVVLVPVVLGMLIRQRAAGFAARMDKPVRIGSAVILAVLVLGILLDQREDVGDYLADVGLAAGVFCAASLVVGYVVPRAAGVRESEAIASSMEIGVHNGTLAIFVAVEVLDSTEMSVPAAVYSVFMFVFAALWGVVLTRYLVGRRDEPATSATA